MQSAIRVIGYVRCSSVEQAADGLSLEAQRLKIASWCEATGAELVEIVEDAGVSGARRLLDRPGGSRIAALLDARCPDADAVVIVRLDRLGRSVREASEYLSRFATGKVGLVSIVDRVDLSTPQGNAMAQIGAVFAELERKLCAQRTAEALQVLKSQRRPYGPTPFGFVANDGKLEPDDGEQRVLKQITRRRNKGISYHKIADELNARGIPAKRGGPWHGMAVRSVLLTSAGIGVCV